MPLKAGVGKRVKKHNPIRQNKGGVVFVMLGFLGESARNKRKEERGAYFERKKEGLNGRGLGEKGHCRTLKQPKASGSVGNQGTSN